MTDLELDEILTLRWPGVMRRVMGDVRTEGFVRGFVRSIARHGKRQAWRPTPKQERLMRQMLVEYSGPPEPDPVLVEGD